MHEQFVKICCIGVASWLVGYAVSPTCSFAHQLLFAQGPHELDWSPQSLAASHPDSAFWLRRHVARLQAMRHLLSGLSVAEEVSLEACHTRSGAVLAGLSHLGATLKSLNAKGLGRVKP